MDLPPGCFGAHDVPFMKTLRNILDSGLPYDSICFKDARNKFSSKIYLKQLNGKKISW